ncbi:nucleotidyltransferase domain-containing protein [Luteimonas sp. SX5]|uniref:Nucleotidyltransferase domain-containing protein n=1 Tax=Luteimonas galliterrae TaxID=2940486 RepID=A0ABT0MP89_9GAMM|nr:nucleotidyltransferase domain-containing protein [Luteimonas galliterrae]MCL1636109.1 nucleotidyltransferase domain-containing protein [Luteimonas galliterrae]
MSSADGSGDIHPIAADKRQAVLDALDGIEREHRVRVLFACESGSRGWGFSSPDSDYDARFIYSHEPDWYVTVLERTRPGQPQRDVIELPIDDDLDVSGWDLRKALRLLAKSNPTLSEWVRSPIVYRQDSAVASELRGLSERFYSPIGAWRHYFSMAKGNYRGYLQGESVRTKKYLYVLRPLLACLWIQRSDDPPPMAFELLLERLLPNGMLRERIDALLAVKRRSAEIAQGPRIAEINEYVERTLAEFEMGPPRLRAAEGHPDELDDFLRRTIRQGLL